MDGWADADNTLRRGKERVMCWDPDALYPSLPPSLPLSPMEDCLSGVVWCGVRLVERGHEKKQRKEGTEIWTNEGGEAQALGMPQLRSDNRHTHTHEHKHRHTEKGRSHQQSTRIYSKAPGRPPSIHPSGRKAGPQLSPFTHPPPGPSNRPQPPHPPSHTHAHTRTDNHGRL